MNPREENTVKNSSLKLSSPVTHSAEKLVISEAWDATQAREEFRNPFTQGLRGVFVTTYGCQMNVNDTERILSLCEQLNFAVVKSPEDADLIIINTCSVREKPVQKVFSEVGTYKHLKKRNPCLRIGIAGCLASQEKKKLLEGQPLIDFVMGTDNIDELPEIIDRIYSRKEKVVSASFRHREPYATETLILRPGVSTFVNIMKGCDNFCSFCVVPFTRGREKSRKLEEIVHDIQNLTRRGVREVTLLGQNVNSYRDEENQLDFADLLEAVALRTNLLRIRFTTSHPKDFNEKLMRVLKKHSSKLCSYVHLPVQSGSNRILELMNRGYTREEYLEKIKKLKTFLPEVSLSTDIIVGFPGETEEDFTATLELIEDAQYETLFAFKYSPRPFTKASKMQDQLSEAEKSNRLQKLFQFYEPLSHKWAKKYENKVIQVLIESYDEKTHRWFGRSESNKNVFIEQEKGTCSEPGEESLLTLKPGELMRAKVTKAYPNVFYAKPC